MFLLILIIPRVLDRLSITLQFVNTSFEFYIISFSLSLISQISKKKIPLLLINARITERSFKRWSLIKSFAKIPIGLFSLDS